MFRMHGTIFAAAGRAESRVVTWYDYPTAAKRQGFTYVSSFYVRVGMNLGVRGRSKDGPQDKDKPGGWTQGIRRLAGGRKRRRLVPAAAAALILIAVGLFLFPLTADGKIALAQVLHGLANVQNVCILSLAPDREEPIRTEWVSKSLGIKLYELTDRVVLRDIKKLTIRIKNLASGEITTTAISPDKLEESRENIEGTLGLLPFSDITDVPDDAQWNHVSDEDVETVIPGTEVYDLIWNESEGGITYWRKWRLFIDTATNLPQRQERYRKPSVGDEYVLRSVRVVSYPSESEIEGLIAETFE
jgi:hypothetical protein